MTEDKLKEAGLSLAWAHDFVTESNLIDPQPGENKPGSLHFDLHLQALLHVLSDALDDRFALPKAIHVMLLPQGTPLAGRLRKQAAVMGFRKMLQPHRVAYFTWCWNADARETISELRLRHSFPAERQQLIWDLHCELMNIRPFEMYNGRVGRLLLVNHAILLGEEPPLVQFSERDAYLQLISSHPSANWVNEKRYRPSAVRYREH